MMPLGKLLQDVITLPDAISILPINDVTDDSRQVKPGSLFVAIKGLTVDGHDYAQVAMDRGAAAVVTARPLDLGIPCIVVDDPARALALALGRLAGDPAGRLTLLGITGTNGKTTTTYMMESILATAGLRPGVVGTVGYRYAGTEERAPFTTPTPRVLHQVLGRMVEAGCGHAVMEVSSHALELGRVWGLEFALAAFTNLTQDHLDLHGSMELYLQAKLLLFTRHLRPGGCAVINLDGAGHQAFVQAARSRGDVKVVGCTTRPGVQAEARLLDTRHSIDGLSATLCLGEEEVPLMSPMPGAFNAENVLLAAACCHAAGVSADQVARGVAALPGVPGRLERVDGGRDFAVLVDYAHTPDALKRAMAVLRPLCKGRLIVVFGCGGDRDRGKRPLMGAAVGRAADLGVVTSDNPRTEDPLAIIKAVEQGVIGAGMPAVKSSGGDGYLVEPDRRQAIFLAIARARPGDIVLIAGKGHEDYQILGSDRIHFDDREQAREALG